jgi:hypothetical protein
MERLIGRIHQPRVDTRGYLYSALTGLLRKKDQERKKWQNFIMRQVQEAEAINKYLQPICA